jgi:uncharacterized phage-associated protein
MEVRAYMNNKLCSLIYYFIKNLPNLNKTEIVKLTYFVDYSFYKYFNKDITGITYKHYKHGPFSKSVYDCIDKMKQENIIKQKENTSLNKQRRYYSYLIVENYDISKYLVKQELDIIEFVIDEFGKLGYEKLTELSYKTEPMEKAKKNDILNFDLINKSIMNKIIEVRKEKGSLNNYFGKPLQSQENEDFLQYQYKIMSN